MNFKFTWSDNAIAAVVLVGLAAATAATYAAERLVSVKLASGRTFQGQIDPASNDETLWLKFGDATANIRRPVQWDRVVAAEQDGKPLTRDELKAAAKTVAAEAKPEEQERPKFRGVFAEPAAPAATDAPQPASASIRSLTSTTVTANFDADADVDGLAVTIFPLDAVGDVTPHDGTLEVELYAPQVRTFNEAPHGRGLTLEKIGSWSVPVAVENFNSAGGATVELPFQAFDPARVERILPQGVVQVRFTIPGQGVFETREDVVRIRPWAPLRAWKR